MNNLARGGDHSRSVAAYQLSKMLGEDAVRESAGEPVKYASDPSLPDTLLGILTDEDETDTTFLSFVALAGAYTGDRRFAEPIVARLAEYYVANPPDQPENLDPMTIGEDPEVTYYMALRQIAAPESVAAIRPWLVGGDLDTRKLVVSTIGAIDSPEASEALRGVLADDLDASVRANAALQLAARRDPAATAMILNMLDPSYVADVPGITDDQRRAWMTQAAAGAATIGGEAFEQPLADLANHQGDPRVVNAARTSLAAIRQGAPAPDPSAGLTPPAP
jgi:HEAT repeat protein